MQNVTAQFWQLCDYFSQNRAVTCSWQKNSRVRARKQNVQKLPCSSERPRLAQSGGMGAHPKKLVTDSARQIPLPCTSTKSVESVMTLFVKLGLPVSSMDQDVCVDN